jgi:hypothetical protein
MAIDQTRKWLKGRAKKLLALRRRLILLTHHKCATTFVQNYLERVCAINSLRIYESYKGTALPEPLYHVSLLRNAEYDRVMRAIDAPALHIIRNPLDIVQSAYYSHLSTHPLSGWPQLEVQRRILANCSKKDGIFLTLAFLEQHEFYPRTPGPLHALRHWRFDDPRICTIRMEDLVADVNNVLGNIVLDSLGKSIRLPEPEDFTFERVSGGRRVGVVDNTSHYRRGLAGAWRSELPEGVIAYCRENFTAVLERYYPDALA